MSKKLYLQHLNSLLERLNLLNKRELFFNSDLTHRKSELNLHVEIESKIDLIKPDAIYIFNNLPYIFFFDLSSIYSKERENLIHKQAWSFDHAPIIFVIKDNEIIVYNAFVFEKTKNELKRLDIAQSEIKDRFSYWELQSGRTWEWLQVEKYTNNLYKNRVNQVLFRNIKRIQEVLTKKGSSALSEEQANILVLRLIFIRYLIDRDVILPTTYIQGVTLDEKRESLSKLIKNTKSLNAFFSYLNKRFNGVLFKDSEFIIDKEHIDFLSKIFSPFCDKTQPTLFDDYYFNIFDFSIIPVEVISGIYEILINEEIKEKDSAIYTPPFLVDYIITQTLDKFHNSQGKSECVVLDPACGSGIFLVQAYRRMVDFEKRKNSTISEEYLKEIAINNLFGVDKNRQALLIASFSIYIALLDYKQPKDIRNFEFPNLLDSNLFEANFFDEEHSFNEVLKTKKIDFILGNPPWKSDKEKIHVDYIKKYKLPIARYEISQTFAFRVRDFSNIDTRCALVVTSKAFYNIWSKGFKQKFLGENFLDLFLDLSAVRHQIFENAINPACVIFFRKSTLETEARNNIVSHISIKSNIFLRNFKTIVIEKFDVKEILQKYFIDLYWMFKVALYGNSLDYHFLNNLFINKNSIKKEINSRKDIFYGDGIKRLTSNFKASVKNKDSKVLTQFLDIKQIPIIEHSKINHYISFVDNNKTPNREDLFVKSGRKIELYNRPKILIKARPEKETIPVISFINENCVFREKVLGISSKNTDNLFLLYGLLISNIYTYFQFFTTSSWGIFYPEIEQEEYLSFPYKEISVSNEFVFLVNAFINNVKDYHLSALKSPKVPIPKEFDEINKIINKTYGVGEIEEDLIDYCLNVSRYQFQESKKNKYLRPVNETELKSYASIFYNDFSMYYNGNGEYFQIDIYNLNHFVAMHFKITNEKPSKEDEIRVISNLTDETIVFKKLSNNLSIWNVSSEIFIQKDIKGFEQNSFYIIKPNEYKCWHRAIARYDLAGINMKIEQAELEHLKERHDDK